jgi:hypothetical protein
MSSFNSALVDCLDLLRRGATIEDCLERYPKHSQKLYPQLSLAHKVMRTPSAAVRPQAQQRAWEAVSLRAAQLRAGKASVVKMPRPGFNFGAWVKPLAFTASAVLAFAAFSGGLVYASQSAMPDSPLYGLKLASEDARLWFVFDEKREAEILLDQSNERIDEITTMVSRGGPVPERALSALQNRNDRAAAILLERSEDTGLRARVLTQAQEQEDLLVALWPEVPADARPDYAETVAHLHNIRLDGGAGNNFVSLRPEELAGGILDISGQAEDVGDGVWKVGGVEVRIDERTFGRQELQSGTSARFVVGRASNGRLHALTLSSFQTGPAPTGAVVSGAVEEVSDDGITVAGQFIPFSDATVQKFPLKVGQRVSITLSTASSGVYADSVDSAAAPVTPTVKTFTYEGTIEGDVSRSTSRWTVGGHEFTITPSTVVDARGGIAADGARAQVEALNRDGELEAVRVTVIVTDDAPDTATIIGNFEGFDETNGVWRISGMAIVPPEQGEDPPEDALVSVNTKRAGADLEVTGYEVIESPDNLALVRFQGTISQIDGSKWSLEFGQVRVVSTAEVEGEPEVGVRVIVWGERGVDGNLQARYVRVLDDEPVLAPAPGPQPSATPVAASR